MLIQKHVKELYIHVADSGVIWFCDETGKACSTNLSAEEFATEEICLKASRIRVLGFHTCADLICRVYETLLQRPDKKTLFQVGTPLYCHVNAVKQPDAVLEAMASLEGLPVSLGGWHEVTVHDAVAYGITASKYARNEPEAALLLLQEHPVIKPLSFIIDLDWACLASLLADIVDPRWYVSCTHPNRTAQLRSYVGLRTELLIKVLSGDSDRLTGTKAVVCERLKLLMGAWTGGNQQPPGVPDLDEPGNFLWRRLLEFPADPVRGWLRASSMFLSFMQSVWLDAMSSQELFVPEYLFRRAGPEVAAVDQIGMTLAAYMEHMVDR